MTRFLKIGKYYINMDRIDFIRHAAGEVVEVVMRDGKQLYCSRKDAEEMKIMEK